jgi:hypothetical protein
MARASVIRMVRKRDQPLHVASVRITRTRSLGYIEERNVMYMFMGTDDASKSEKEIEAVVGNSLRIMEEMVWIP